MHRKFGQLAAIVTVGTAVLSSSPALGVASAAAFSAVPAGSASRPLLPMRGECGPALSFCVNTFATATGLNYGGKLYAGDNYVYCKVWGPRVGNSTQWNHWWLYTDMDTGGQDTISAYYLTYWGNDEAKDNWGNTIYDCP